jgi:hypothetical protein
VQPGILIIINFILYLHFFTCMELLPSPCSQCHYPLSAGLLVFVFTQCRVLYCHHAPCSVNSVKLATHHSASNIQQPASSNQQPSSPAASGQQPAAQQPSSQQPSSQQPAASGQPDLLLEWGAKGLFNSADTATQVPLGV